MRVGVTGSNGFVGKHLVDFLRKKNISVKPLAKKKIGEDILNNLSSDTDWESTIKNLDVIIHCGGRVHKDNKESYLNKKFFREINVNGTKKLAEQAAKLGVKKFIFLSTIKVNGENTNSCKPFNRSSATNPIDQYAKSKFEAEEILNQIQKKSNMAIVIIRIPLVYGPSVKANFKKLLWIIHKGFPLPFKNTKNKRSYIYIKNLVALIYECSINSNADNKIFLASDMKDISTPELITKLKKLFNSRTFLFSLDQSFLNFLFKIINQKQMLDRLTDSLCISSHDSFSDLRFTPPYSLDEGLKDTVDWFLDDKRRGT